ncbi:unnamed protein product [Moneuplotes crassus]|uniref:Uncharacterized protein n=1 Tax=Euplotes crassus TaxID=5936 RepID=A0AAD1U7M8_EUPCR|nr:unnamed protein product [Moneuplotes crassus]
MEGIHLSNKEADFFQKVFTLVAKENANVAGELVRVVSAEELKRVFMTSGISNEILAQVWRLCVGKKRVLAREGFFKALKCIAVAQKNESLDDIAVYLKEEFSLPVFEDEDIQELMPNVIPRMVKEPVEEEVRMCRDSDDSESEEEFVGVSGKIEEEKIEIYDRPRSNTFSKSSRIGVEESKASSGLHISVPCFDIVRQGWLGINSYTLYKIVTTAHNFPPLKNDEYVVWRRFSDFEWLHNLITQTNSFEGFVLPKLPEKPYFQRQNEEFFKTRKNSLEGYIKTLVSHPSLNNSEPIHHFLTEQDEDKFNSLMQKEASSWKDSIYSYALKVKNFDVDRFVTNIGQYFDSEEPKHFRLDKKYLTQIDHLFDYETQLENLVDSILENHKTNHEISDKMSKVALRLEKYRMDTEQRQLTKLFTKGNTLSDEYIDDLDDLPLSKVDSRETIDAAKDYDKIERLPFLKNIFPALIAGATANKAVTENWKELHTDLQAQLYKVKGLRETLQRRSTVIAAYKTNIIVLNKKKLKISSSYNFENLQPEIDSLERENKDLEKKIETINKALCDDLFKFTLNQNIKTILEKFLERNIKEVSKGVKKVASQSSRLSDK